MAPQNAPGAPAKGLVGKVGGSKNAAILAAGGTVALVALLGLRKSKTAAAAPASATATGTYDSTTSDLWNQWESQYEQLSQRIDSLQAGQTTASGPGTPKPPTPVPIPKPPTPTPAPPGKQPGPKPRPVHKPPKPPKRRGGGSRTVTVRRGDTLSGIGAKYGDSLAKIKRLNPGYWRDKKYDDGNEIWAGDKVNV